MQASKTKDSVMNYKKLLRSFIIILAFFFAVYGKRLLQPYVAVSFDSRILTLIYAYAWWLVPIVLVTGFLYGFKNILNVLGLDKGFFTGLAFALAAVAPMLISSAVIGEIDKDPDWLDLLKKTFVAGFAEEILFRGFLFGILFRKLGWGFIPAALLGAVIFGLSHLYQGSTPGELLGLFLITGIGSAWFAWLYIEWKENLWVPIFLHALMNLSWLLFNVSGNALGDTYTNIFRFITIAFTIVATVYYNIRKDKFRVTSKNLLVSEPESV